jgi:hypothetical protein
MWIKVNTHASKQRLSAHLRQHRRDPAANVEWAGNLDGALGIEKSGRYGEDLLAPSVCAKTTWLVGVSLIKSSWILLGFLFSFLINI